MRQRGAFDQLQHQRGHDRLSRLCRCFFDAVNGADMWMVQRGEDARFSLETRETVGVLRELRQEES